MKTRIQKIIIVTAAMLFVFSGVSFAHDRNYRDRKPPGKAYGHYKVIKLPPGRTHKHFKPNPPISKRYVYKHTRDHRFYRDHHRRPAPRRSVVYKHEKKDPFVVFKIILKDLR